jgi:hypothetical protein
MTVAAKDIIRHYEAEPSFGEYPVKAATKIFEGIFVGDDGAGASRGLVAGDPFKGMSLRQADNLLGLVGAANVKVRRSGFVKIAVAGLVVTDEGADVYASDDNTATLTASTNTRIGYVDRFISAGIGMIYFTANDGVIAALTDNSGGTPADTIAVIGATYDQAEVANAVASLAAKINHFLQKQGN